MPYVAFALPVLPGQAERARRFGEELKHVQAEYEALNRKATVRRHLAWLQQTPMGDLLITVFEADDPRRLGRSFTESAYDRWWLDYLMDVHGIDLSKGTPPGLPDLVFNWGAKVAPKPKTAAKAKTASKARRTKKAKARRKAARSPKKRGAARKARRARRS